MKRNHYLMNISLLAVLIPFTLVFTSCADFDEINTSKTKKILDPNSLISGDDGGTSDEADAWDNVFSYTEAELTEIAKIDEQANFRNFSYEGVYNDYQRTTNLFHDFYSGYFANNKPSFNNSTPNYAYNDGWMSNRWQHFYQDRMKEYRLLSKKLKGVDHASGKYKNAYYITQIHMCFLASLMTDTYGDIPFSIFLDKEDPSVMVYDTQQKVYDLLFKRLTTAAKNIVPGTSAFKFTDNADNCYNGDEDKWRKFANTLRLRLALRISNVDPERAKTEGEAAIAAGLMTSNSDNMKTVPLNFFGNGGNENVHALVGFMWMDVCMSKDMEEHYYNQTFQNRLDPRCKKLWFKPTPYDLLSQGIEDDDPELKYTGRYCGEDSPEHSSENVSILKSKGSILDDDYWWSYKQESIWLGYSECNFLLAEAALRNWNGTTRSVKEYFEEGIRQSMLYYKINNEEILDYISNLKIYYNGGDPFATGSRETQLEQIITQKWLAVFPNGAEGWAEFRRTDYPRLHDVAKNVSEDVANGTFIKRIQYPVSEHDNNYMNIPENDRQDKKLWWDVAETNSSPFTRAQPNNFR